MKLERMSPAQLDVLRERLSKADDSDSPSEKNRLVLSAGWLSHCEQVTVVIGHWDKLLSHWDEKDGMAGSSVSVLSTTTVVGTLFCERDGSEAFLAQEIVELIEKGGMDHYGPLRNMLLMVRRALKLGEWGRMTKPVNMRKIAKYVRPA